MESTRVVFIHELWSIIRQRSQAFRASEFYDTKQTVQTTFHAYYNMHSET